MPTDKHNCENEIDHNKTRRFRQQRVRTVRNWGQIMTNETKHLTNRAYARRLGVDESLVRKWLRQGKMEKDPKTGKIDPSKADAMLAESLGRLSPVSCDIGGHGKTRFPGRASLTRAQTEKVNVETQIARVKLAELEDRLVDKEAVLEFVFKLFRAERDALIAWPGRIGHEFALDLQQQGLEPRAVICLLEKYVKRYLTERADAERPHTL